MIVKICDRCKAVIPRSPDYIMEVERKINGKLNIHKKMGKVYGGKINQNCLPNGCIYANSWSGFYGSKLA